MYSERNAAEVCKNHTQKSCGVLKMHASNETMWPLTFWPPCIALSNPAEKRILFWQQQLDSQ